MLQREKSQSIYQSSCAVIPGGVNSPARACLDVGISPMIVERGEGDTIWDVDGHSYLDFCGSWGALILGHCNPSVQRAVFQQMAKGTTFGITTKSEQELAAQLIQSVPSLEKVRFVSSGTEATMSAIRLARGYTGRSLIVKFSGHYHGHSDCLLIQAGSGVSTLPMASSLGVPEDLIRHTVVLPFNDSEGVQQFFKAHGDALAAVIVEPIAGNMGVVPGDRSFLHLLRQETEKCGAVLIFDEVITGFRVGLSGAQGLYEIDPDLSCFGKIIGGGFPAAAFGGRNEIMNCLAPLGGVYQAGTLSGNPVAMEAGIATLQAVQQPGFYEQLQAKTDRFIAPLRQALGKQGCVQQVGSMFTLFFGPEKVRGKSDLEGIDQTIFKEFFAYLFERGIYIPPSPFEAWFISAAHTEDHLAYAQQVILDFICQQ